MQLLSATAMAAQQIQLNDNFRWDWHQSMSENDRDKVVDHIYRAVRPSMCQYTLAPLFPFI